MSTYALDNNFAAQVLEDEADQPGRSWVAQAPLATAAACASAFLLLLDSTRRPRN